MSTICHKPVMLREVIENVAPKNDDIIVDATFGRGGYSQAFLRHSNCTVYAIDRDPDAVEYAQTVKAIFPKRFHILQGCFANILSLLRNVGVERVHAITFDLGVSSPQLEDAKRGFSFRKYGPLDMRMSKEGICAKDIVNTYSTQDIAHILRAYGEEKKANSIAQSIVRQRQNMPIETTDQLANIVRKVCYKPQNIDPATRTFQGLRIAVNNELSELEEALIGSVDLLHHGGRLAVVSFHSLEDRIVKRFMRKESHKQQNNRHDPPVGKQCCRIKMMADSFITCSKREKQQNPRARSAKLRLAIRWRANEGKRENKYAHH